MSRLRRKRVVVPVAVIAVVVLALVVLWSTGLVVPTVGGRGSSMSPTFPTCNARYLAEGFTYHFRSPHRGEIVLIHARGQLGGSITPDPEARDLNLTKRVIAGPGDTVTWRNGRVYVNGAKADDIETPLFEDVRLGPDEYFVLGDNRTYAQDSRDFGPVPRNTIFARVFLTYWPLSRIGVPGYNKALVPPGQVPCGS